MKIGILPGWGGTMRMPRLIGLRKALPLLLTGKALPPKKARKVGLIDETLRPEALLAGAKRLALSGKKDRKLGRIDRLTTTGPIRRRILKAAREKTLAQTHGNYPAPIKVLQVTETNYANGPEAGLAAERESLRELMDTGSCQNLI